jgi:serine/threonine protein kinase
MGEEAASPDPHIPATPFESEGPTRPTPAAHEAWHDRAVGAAGLPASIGGYRVVSLLGQGGMGAVYLAEQEKPHRRVALKLMRAGASSERALRRFEHEAELLGRLVHPGIAQIYEAGLAEGVPFFAMELVEGRTLLAYCDETKMGTRERLALFARICDAVHHAHTKGVIHRDLKPGNIL